MSDSMTLNPSEFTMSDLNYETRAQDSPCSSWTAHNVTDVAHIHNLPADLVSGICSPVRHLLMKTPTHRATRMPATARDFCFLAYITHF